MSFHADWETVKNCFKNQQKLCDELASIYPAMSQSEDEFIVIYFAKIVFKISLVDFALKRTFHSIQYDRST